MVASWQYESDAAGRCRAQDPGQSWKGDTIEANIGAAWLSVVCGA